MLCYNRCVYLGEEKTLKKMERKIHHVGFGINSQIPKCNISEVKNCGKSLYVTILTKGHTCESKLIEYARKCNVSCEYLLEDWEKGIYINTDPTGEYFPVRYRIDSPAFTEPERYEYRDLEQLIQAVESITGVTVHNESEAIAAVKTWSLKNQAEARVIKYEYF